MVGITNWFKENRNRLLFGIFLVIPFFLGMFGMRALGEGSYLECAYKSVQLYTLEFSVEAYPLNAAVVIARWMAPLMTVATIITALSSFFESVRIWWKIRMHKDTVVVHGDSDDIGTLMKNMGKQGIRSEKPITRLANRHILMFKEDYDMYRFMNENMEGFLADPKKKIYLCSEKISRGSYEQNQLVACNIAENCARGYWKKYPIRKMGERICIIGFGNYGQRLLTQGILTNVYSLDSRIEYHVAGDYHEFLTKHYKMDRAIRIVRVAQDGTQTTVGAPPVEDIGDVVYFYDGDWYDMLAQVSDFDRVILVYDEDAKNIEILNEVKTCFINNRYHVKLSDDRLVEMLWRNETSRKTGGGDVFTFGTNDELYDLDVILNDRLFYQAKMINAYYFAKYHDQRPPKEYLGEPEFEADWEGLNTFTRYSNVAAADHIQVKLRILEEYLLMQKEAKAGHALSDEEKDEILAKLTDEELADFYTTLNDETQHTLWWIEHVRWCRYHFMNNWDYCAKRDNSRHLHHYLVSFDRLPEEIQSLDGEIYRALKVLV